MSQQLQWVNSDLCKSYHSLGLICPPLPCLLNVSSLPCVCTKLAGLVTTVWWASWWLLVHAGICQCSCQCASNGHCHKALYGPFVSEHTGRMCVPLGSLTLELGSYTWSVVVITSQKGYCRDGKGAKEGTQNDQRAGKPLFKEKGYHQWRMYGVASGVICPGCQLTGGIRQGLPSLESSRKGRESLGT